MSQPNKPVNHYLDGGYQVDVVGEEAGMWIARVRALPSCLAQGATMDEAVKRLEGLFQVYVRARYARGATIPEPDLPVEVKAQWLQTPAIIGGEVSVSPTGTHWATPTPA